MLTMMSLSLSATTKPQPSAVDAKKHPAAAVRSGADLQVPYAPLPTPTAAAADAFTPTTASLPTAESTTETADAAPTKKGLDPVAGAVGVAALALTSSLLPFATKGNTGHWADAAKVFLGAGLGVAATFLAPLGGNLVKDILKKKPSSKLQFPPSHLCKL
jgi:hypothetical protein